MTTTITAPTSAGATCAMRGIVLSPRKSLAGAATADYCFSALFHRPLGEERRADAVIQAEPCCQARMVDAATGQVGRNAAGAEPGPTTLLPQWALGHVRTEIFGFSQVSITPELHSHVVRARPRCHRSGMHPWSPAPT